MDRLHENRIYTGTVESYSSEGLGIVRLDGAVVFVPQAVRGETIDLKITKVMKTAAAGEIVKIHKPSPDRAQPECPDYGRCGGCDFQHLTYPEELWAKRQRVQDALTRLGGADIRVEEILGEKYRTLWGRDYLMDTLCGLEFKLSVPSFYQVNRDQAEALYGKALDYAGLTGRETVLDLYCGIGTITLCLAKRAGRVIGAEIVPAAIRDAKENAARNHIENAEFFCGDAAETAARLEAEGLRPDVITVDPPRKGLAPEVIGSIAAMGPERVVYVSCDPATLGRDVKRFGELGYRAVRACAVDMFPATRHVESVVLLERS